MSYKPLYPDISNPAYAPMAPYTRPTNNRMFGSPSAKRLQDMPPLLRQAGIPDMKYKPHSGGGENDCMWTQVFMILVILWLLYQILPWILESCGMNSSEIEYRGRHRYNKNYYV